jgi:hypothetical protein
MGKRVIRWRPLEAAGDFPMNFPSGSSSASDGYRGEHRAFLRDNESEILGARSVRLSDVYGAHQSR